jgi:hypothetical protein
VTNTHHGELLGDVAADKHNEDDGGDDGIDADGLHGTVEGDEEQPDFIERSPDKHKYTRVLEQSTSSRREERRRQCKSAPSRHSRPLQSDHPSRRVSAGIRWTFDTPSHSMVLNSIGATSSHAHVVSAVSPLQAGAGGGGGAGGAGGARGATRRKSDEHLFTRSGADWLQKYGPGFFG